MKKMRVFLVLLIAFALIGIFISMNVISAASDDASASSEKKCNWFTKLFGCSETPGEAQGGLLNSIANFFSFNWVFREGTTITFTKQTCSEITCPSTAECIFRTAIQDDVCCDSGRTPGDPDFVCGDAGGQECCSPEIGGETSCYFHHEVIQGIKISKGDCCDVLHGKEILGSGQDQICCDEGDTYCSYGTPENFCCLKTGDVCNPSLGCSKCGNDVKDTGEECDDGNLNNDDDCTNACKWRCPASQTPSCCVGKTCNIFEVDISNPFCGIFPNGDGFCCQDPEKLCGPVGKQQCCGTSTTCYIAKTNQNDPSSLLEGQCCPTSSPTLSKIFEVSPEHSICCTKDQDGYKFHLDFKQNGLMVGGCCDKVPGSAESKVCSFKDSFGQDEQQCCSASQICDSNKGCGLCGNGVKDTGEECDEKYCTTSGGKNTGKKCTKSSDCGDAELCSIDSVICTTECKRPFCGNKYSDDDFGEECDDGYACYNKIDGKDVVQKDWTPGDPACGINQFVFIKQTDTCSPPGRNCRYTYCGDGITQNPDGRGMQEACDEGVNNDWTKTCSPECTKTFCGDLVVQTPNYDGVAETCDQKFCFANDGTRNTGTLCSFNEECSPLSCAFDENICTLSCEENKCGNGITESPETCDYGRACVKDENGKTGIFVKVWDENCLTGTYYGLVQDNLNNPECINCGKCSSNTDCNDNNDCTDDACNTNTGACTHTNVPNTPKKSCTMTDNTNGYCYDGECVACISDSDCEDNNICTTDTCGSDKKCSHNPAPSTTVCRAASGNCDVAETCSGTSASCPSDAVKTSNTICRAASGNCDEEEKCDGSSKSCPTDVFKSSGTVCRAEATGGCDEAEKCTGNSKDCPTDVFKSSGTVCRAIAGICDVAETCSGTSASCPSDAFKPNTQVCRPEVEGGCDEAEKCTGNSKDCPSDVKKIPGTSCTPSGTADVCKYYTCDSNAACIGNKKSDAECVTGEIFVSYCQNNPLKYYPAGSCSSSCTKPAPTECTTTEECKTPICIDISGCGAINKQEDTICTPSSNNIDPCKKYKCKSGVCLKTDETVDNPPQICAQTGCTLNPTPQVQDCIMPPGNSLYGGCAGKQTCKANPAGGDNIFGDCEVNVNIPMCCKGGSSLAVTVPVPVPGGTTVVLCPAKYKCSSNNPSETGTLSPTYELDDPSCGSGGVPPPPTPPSGGPSGPIISTPPACYKKDANGNNVPDPLAKGTTCTKVDGKTGCCDNKGGCGACDCKPTPTICQKCDNSNPPKTVPDATKKGTTCTKVDGKTKGCCNEAGSCGDCGCKKDKECGNCKKCVKSAGATTGKCEDIPINTDAEKKSGVAWPTDESSTGICCKGTSAGQGNQFMLGRTTILGCGCKSDSDCSDCQTCPPASTGSSGVRTCIDVVVPANQKGVEWTKVIPGTVSISGMCCKIKRSGANVLGFYAGVTECPKCTESSSDGPCKCYECYTSTDPQINIACLAGMICKDNKCEYKCEKDEDCNKPPVDKSKAPKICKNHQCINAECGYDCAVGIFTIIEKKPACKNPMYTRGFKNTIEGCLNSQACVNMKCQACNCNADCKYTFFMGEPALFCINGECTSREQIYDSFSSVGSGLDSPPIITSPPGTCTGPNCPVTGSCKNCPCPYPNQKKNVYGNCVCTKKNQEIKNPDINGYGPCECKDNSLKLDEDGECVCKSERNCYSGTDNEYYCKCSKSTNDIQMIKNSFGDCECPANMVEIGGSETSIGSCICKNGGGDPVNNCQVKSVGKTCFKIRSFTSIIPDGSGLTKVDCPDRKEVIQHNCTAWTCFNYGGENACGAEKTSGQTTAGQQADSMANGNNAATETAAATGTPKLKCGEWPDGCGGKISCGNNCTPKYICKQETDGSQSIYKVEGYCKMSKSASGEITSDCVYDSASLSASEKPTKVKINDCGTCGKCMNSVYNSISAKYEPVPITQEGSSDSPEDDYEGCMLDEELLSSEDIPTTNSDSQTGTGSGTAASAFAEIEAPSNNLIICRAKPEDTPCQGPGEKLCCGLQSPYVCKSTSTSLSPGQAMPDDTTTLSQGGSMADGQPSQTATSTSSGVNMKCVKKEISVPEDCEKCDMKEEMKKVGEEVNKNICNNNLKLYDKIKTIFNEQAGEFKKNRDNNGLNDANIDGYINLATLAAEMESSQCKTKYGINNAGIRDPYTEKIIYPIWQLESIEKYLSKNKKDPKYLHTLLMMANYYQNFEKYLGGDSKDCVSYLKKAEKLYWEVKNLIGNANHPDQKKIDNMLAVMYMRQIICYKNTRESEFLKSPENAIIYANDPELNKKIKTNILNIMILELDSSIKEGRKEIERALPYNFNEFNSGQQFGNDFSGWAKWGARVGDFYFYHMPETRNMYSCLYGKTIAPTREDANKVVNEKASLILAYKDGFKTLKEIFLKSKSSKLYCNEYDDKKILTTINDALGIGLTPDQITLCAFLSKGIPNSQIPTEMAVYAGSSNPTFSNCYKLLIKKCNMQFACEFSDIQRINEPFKSISEPGTYGQDINVDQFKFMGFDDQKYLGYETLKYYPYSLLSSKEKTGLYENIYYVNFFTVSKNAVMAYGLFSGVSSFGAAIETSLWRGAAITGEFAGFMVGSEYVTKYCMDWDPQSGEFAADVLNLVALPVAVKGAKIIAKSSGGVTLEKPVYGWLGSEAEFSSAIAKSSEGIKGITSSKAGEYAIGEFTINGKKVKLGYGDYPGVDVAKDSIDSISKKVKQCEESAKACKAKNNGEKPAVCEVDPTTGGCFLADTPIKMADGTYKSIQDILKGERVSAFDVNNKKPADADVTTTFVRPEDKYRIVQYEVVE